VNFDSRAPMPVSCSRGKYDTLHELSILNRTLPIAITCSIIWSNHKGYKLKEIAAPLLLPNYLSISSSQMLIAITPTCSKLEKKCHPPFHPSTLLHPPAPQLHNPHPPLRLRRLPLPHLRLHKILFPRPKSWLQTHRHSTKIRHRSRSMHRHTRLRPATQRSLRGDKDSLR
jgi:hypothetical protein